MIDKGITEDKFPDAAGIAEMLFERQLLAILFARTILADPEPAASAQSFCEWIVRRTAESQITATSFPAHANEEWKAEVVRQMTVLAEQFGQKVLALVEADLKPPQPAQSIPSED